MVQLVDFLFTLLYYALTLYTVAIFIYIIMSFVGGRDSAFGEMLGKLVEPYLEIFRSFIPPIDDRFIAFSCNYFVAFCWNWS
ncbi:cell division protein YlmG/Ycf19 [Bacillus sp. JCM 19046]|nr:cell division protein YlmG/Ycf19 [Bacillus sp. JCM 19045]GAF16462.1 cell division protein YlmG/Ycf19 [Bacillus sp. JCM 19046]